MSTQRAVGIELPAVIDAADAAFLVAAEPEIGAAMRAILVDDADHAAGVAEGEQFLAHDDDLFRRAVGLRQFRGQQHRHPEPAQQFAHSRPRTALGQELVVFGAEHRASSGICFAFGRAWRRPTRSVNAALRLHTGRSPFTVTRVPERVCGQ